MSDNKQRELGYYWVKYEGKWVVAEYYMNKFFGTNWRNGLLDSEFDLINETKLNPPA